MPLQMPGRAGVFGAFEHVHVEARGFFNQAFTRFPSNESQRLSALGIDLLLFGQIHFFDAAFEILGQHFAPRRFFAPLTSGGTIRAMMRASFSS